ncbi:MAG: winged helix-turn-helix domain-containing protein [Chloroflexi bacterium]|nr:winged helix-turn-helix domain-containing protein [Chloroflexota bacterium]
METTSLRFYLTGRVCAESATAVLDESQFPSRQARLLFAYLVCHRAQPIPRQRLAEALWPGDIPAAWDAALKSLVSKLRQFLGRLEAGPSGLSISSQFGCLPAPG